MNERIYELPRRLVVRTRIGIGYMVVLGIGVLFAARSPWWLCGTTLPVYAWAAWSVSWGLARKRVRETRAGIRTSEFVSGAARLLAWDTIDRFEPVRGKSSHMVCVVTKSGRRSVVVGLDTRTTMKWNGGQTDDIVGELNDRLAGWRAEAADGASP